MERKPRPDAPVPGVVNLRAEEETPEVATRICNLRGEQFPRICDMGNPYRFVEPVVLLLLKKGRSYGYYLSNELRELALTDAEVERAAQYRTLRTPGKERKRRF